MTTTVRLPASDIKTKSARGRLSLDQQSWLAHLGDHGCVWRPRDSDEVQARLARAVGV